MEGVLDTVLERFETRYLDLHAEADRLLTVATPTSADLKVLRDYLPNNPVTRHYFFEGLQHPGWLQPLVDAGFFSDPPQTTRDSPAGTVLRPDWPVTAYLKRMASVPECRERVAQILRDIPETDNAVVHEALANVLLQLPADTAVGLVDRVAVWVKQDIFTRLAEKAGELAVRLLAADHKDEALFLLHAVLDPGRFPPSDSAARRPLDTYWYSQVLEKSLPEFSRRWPQDTLRLLGDLLEQTIRAAESDPEGALYSSVRRRSIESAEPWRRYEIVDMLVDAVRDLSRDIARTSPEAMRQVTHVLEERRLGIFRRIAPYVLGTDPAAAPGLVEERLRRRDLFDAWHREREYLRLLQLSFSHLTPEAQAEIFGWIEQGPAADDYAGKTDEEFQAIKRGWQRSRVRPLVGHIPVEWERRFGPFESPSPGGDDGDSDEGGWVGPTSPRSSDDLNALAPEDLVELLRSWRPKSGWRESSPEGLGRALTEAVGKDPVRLADHARLFRELDATYVRGIIQGFQEALKNAKTFDWSGVLDLCEWVVQQPRQAERAAGDRDRDPGWSWSRKAVASLVAKGVDSETNPIPITGRNQVWRVLEPITWDPDPSPARDTGPPDDALQVAINSVRGEAMIAVIRLAVWLEKHLRQTNAPDRGLAAMPEVERNLSEHLDIARELSPAIRSIFGEAFPVLHWIDAEWARQHVNLVFAEPRGSHVPRAAWNTYLQFARPYDDLFPLLEGFYRAAVSDLDASSSKADIDSAEHHLGMHLMSFLWRGVATADTVGRDFLLHAGVGLRRSAFDFIGRSLMNTAGEVSPEASSRLRSLWDWWRTEAKSRGLVGRELEAFGWWLGSGKCGNPWAIEQALWVLSTGATLEPDHLVAKFLEGLVSAEPLAAVRILDGLWENARDQWTIYGWRDECHAVLQTALSASDDEAVRIARAMVNKLAARGHLEFRSLLSVAS
jgi:hypothetical protein